MQKIQRMKKNLNHMFNFPEGKDRGFELAASFNKTGPTHLPHSLQGKKLASEGTGTTSSSESGLSSGWEMGVICET